MNFVIAVTLVIVTSISHVGSLQWRVSGPVQVSIHAVSVVLGFVNLQYLIGDHLPFLEFSSSHDFGQIGFSMFWWPRTTPIHAVSVVLDLCELIGEGHAAMDNIHPVPCTACYNPADQSWPSNTMVWLL